MTEMSASAYHRVLAAVKHAPRAAAAQLEPLLVAVSKTKPADEVLRIYDQGHRHFGENYVNEWVQKAAVLPRDIKWHFVGHLQSNKVNLVTAIPNLHLFETIHSEKIARLLNNSWEVSERPEPLRVLVQVNTSGEENKHGVSCDGCVDLVRYVVSECPHLSFQGLMTIGEIGRDPNLGPNPDFLTLVKCRERVSSALDIPIHRMHLSMGMSTDFEQAIGLGSTIVRVGSTIFGARTPKKQEQTVLC